MVHYQHAYQQYIVFTTCLISVLSERLFNNVKADTQILSAVSGDLNEVEGYLKIIDGKEVSKTCVHG